MSKDFTDCKEEVVSILRSCLAYLCLQKLIRPFYIGSIEIGDELTQQIEDTLRIFAPELVEEAEHD